MGRPPPRWCDKILGIKKGAWSPEEDILLVSYIQQQGPGNWRSLPTNTGLMRCSKSYRLGWTNYLRPGIKRGNFTHHEEKMIIHLQALLGNRWAAIASYLPQRTDNDKKNYWNTHIKKKKKKKLVVLNKNINIESGSEERKGEWERKVQTDVEKAKKALSEALSLIHNHDNPSPLPLPLPLPNHPYSSPYYASSYGNIARLLENWMSKKKKSPNSAPAKTDYNSFSNMVVATGSSSRFTSTSSEGARSTTACTQQAPLTLLEKWLSDDHGGYSVLEESTARLF